MHIGLVVQDGCFGSSVASIVDIFTIAEVVRPQIDSSIPPVDLEIAGTRRHIHSTGGMTITTTRTLSELEDLDVVVVPALGTITGPATEDALDTTAGRAVVRALATIDPERSRIAAACTGVFPLAETGVLDGRSVTTTWFLTGAFKKRYPKVSVDLDRMVVADGPILTAGAAFAHIDLALALLRGVSTELTRQVAQLLLIDERPSQAAYVVYDHLQHDDPIVLAFERYVRQHLERPLDTAAVAREIGTSRRTLERRTRQVLDMTPLDITKRLRIERANFLRRTTDLTTEAIARRVGYGSGETLRALQRRSNHPAGRPDPAITVP